MRDQQDEKLQLGKGRSYFVKSQLKRLRQEDDIWEADFFPVPQQGLWIGLVISHTDDFVFAHQTIEEPPTVNDLARLLAEAMRRPLVEFSHRPRTLYIRERPEWGELLPHLKQVGIQVVYQDKLPKWDDAFGDLYAQVEQPGAVAAGKGKTMARKKGPAASENTDQSSVLDATFPLLPREALALNLSEAQRSSILKYTTLPDSLAQRMASKVTDEAANQFTPDELDELLNHIEMAVFRAKGNEKQKILRIVEKVSKVLGSDIDAAEFSKRRSSTKTNTAFQIKITLEGIDPPIWRRLQTKDCTLESLHAVIQVVMGWEFEHLYRFEVGGVEFSDVESDMDDEVQDVRAFKLSDVIPASHRRPRFSYEYDLGDGWKHQLIVEERFEPKPGVAYPVCIAGARACPPEDCGGPWGYADFIEAIQNSKHKRHEELLEWVGGEFDSAVFNRDAVNKELAKVR